MTFFRQIALLLPSAFLLGVLLFLATHGRDDPGFGTYPFFSEWMQESRAVPTPEARFVEQSILFFVPVYAVTLLFVVCVVVAESALFGRRPRSPVAGYRRSFAGIFWALLLVGSAALVVVGDRLAARYTPGALVAPLLVAFAPFGGAVIAIAPAAFLALPAAALRRAGDA